MKDVCKKIKRAMQDSNLTQAQLAKKLGVNQQTISKWTTGLLNPKLSTIEKIAKQTKKPLSYFIDNSSVAYQDLSGRNSHYKEIQQVIHYDDSEKIYQRVESLELKIKNLELQIELLLERQKNEKK